MRASSRNFWTTGLVVSTTFFLAVAGCGDDDDDGGGTAGGGAGGAAGKGGIAGAAAGKGGAGGSGGGTTAGKGGTASAGDTSSAGTGEMSEPGGAGGEVGLGGAGLGGAGLGGAGGEAVAPLALNCATYCAEIMATCVAANAQFTVGVNPVDPEAYCLATCAAYPPGAQADTSGNTLGCRNNQIQDITENGQPAVTGCENAGPAGGQLAGAGVCGTPCDDFCDTDVKVCGTDAVPVVGVTNRYTDKAACMTACANFNKAPEFSAPAPAANTLACRIYHLGNASYWAGENNTANVNIHCGHTLAPATGVCQ